MKRTFALMCLLCLLLSGCTMIDKNSGNKNNKLIAFNQPNIFTVSFKDLYSKISKAIDAEYNNISITGGPDVTIDLLFTPEGEITSFKFIMWAEQGSTEYDLIMGQYIMDDNGDLSYPEKFSTPHSTITALNVHCRESNALFAKYIFYKRFDYKQFPQTMSWLDSFDFQAFLKQYTVGNPVRFQLVSGPISKNVLAPDVKVTFLDCSSSIYKEVTPEIVPDSEEIVPDSENPGPDLKIAGLDGPYFAIIPYYIQDGTMKGFDEKELGQNEKITYIANNILILLPE